MHLFLSVREVSDVYFLSSTCTDDPFPGYYTWCFLYPDLCVCVVVVRSFREADLKWESVSENNCTWRSPCCFCLRQHSVPHITFLVLSNPSRVANPQTRLLVCCAESGQTGWAVDTIISYPHELVCQHGEIWVSIRYYMWEIVRAGHSALRTYLFRVRHLELLWKSSFDFSWNEGQGGWHDHKMSVHELSLCYVRATVCLQDDIMIGLCDDYGMAQRAGQENHWEESCSTNSS